MKISERVTKLETQFESIMDGISKLDKSMEGLDHLVRGNGAPGLVEKQATMQTQINTLENSRNKWRDAFFSVGGGLVVGLILFLFQTSWRANHDTPKQNMSQMQQKP